MKGNTRSRGIKGTTALSWGVFPNREVQQPTIFDPETYMVYEIVAFGCGVHGGRGCWSWWSLSLSVRCLVFGDVGDIGGGGGGGGGVFVCCVRPTSVLPFFCLYLSEGVERGGLSTLGGPVGIPLRRRVEERGAAARGARHVLPGGRGGQQLHRRQPVGGV